MISKEFKQQLKEEVKRAESFKDIGEIATKIREHLEKFREANR